MKITLDSHPSNAPCCIRIEAEDGRDILIQTDWDYPGIASTFGWSVSSVKLGKKRDCDHPNTDGTIDCDCCGLKAGEFISAAYEWISDNDGATAEDPGYFNND